MYPYEPVTSDELRVARASYFRAALDKVAVHLGANVGTSTLGDITIVTVDPPNPGARAMRLSFGYLILLEVGDIGGKWEADYSDEMVEDLEEIIAAVVAGHVSEIFAPWRSRVDVVVGDGQVVSESGYKGWVTGILPMPYWTRWGRRVDYEPYGAQRQRP